MLRSLLPVFYVRITGNQARAAAARSAGVVVNPFSHARTLISDFTSAEQLLKAFMRRLVTFPDGAGVAG